MLKILSVYICFFVLTSCENKTKSTHEAVDKEHIEEKIFGNKIKTINAKDAFLMTKQYKTMQIGDSIPSKIIGKVTGVCKVKGCWMTLDLDGDNEIMVKFKDYAFFVPPNIVGHQAIINGKAYVEETSIKTLKHYAKDAGKSNEYIANIKKSEYNFLFEADGVIIKP